MRGAILAAGLVLVTIDVRGVGGGFKGQLSADGKTLAGQWAQLGQSFPLTLTRK